jgi:hypothetical protein
MNNLIYVIDYHLLKWREASISTPHGRRLFYFHVRLDVVQFLPRQRLYTDHMVYGATDTINVEGDCVYSKMNSADWGWETLDRHPTGPTTVLPI